MKNLIVVAVIFAAAAAQTSKQYTTPIPILKQINKHNEDGSYSYGYEGADGSYKIESKYPNGEVYGKYGYVDDTGKMREIEYGASGGRGFEPAGNEINVPPPTLNNNPEAIKPLGPNEEDDGQYREDPSVYYKDDKYNSKNSNVARPSGNFGFSQNQVTYDQPNTYQQSNTYQQPATYQQQSYQQPAYQQQPRQSLVQHGFQSNQQQPTYRQNNYSQQQSSYTPQNNYAQQPSYTPQNNYVQQQQQQRPVYYNNPAFPNFNPFSGHPAQNLDVGSGSYSVNYKR